MGKSHAEDLTEWSGPHFGEVHEEIFPTHEFAVLQ